MPLEAVADPVADLVGDREAEAAERRVVAAADALVRVQHDAALGGQEHPRAVDVPALLDAQAEEVLRDRLDRHRQPLTAEEVEVSLADGMRARILVCRCHRHAHPLRSGAACKEPVYLVRAARRAAAAGASARVDELVALAISVGSRVIRGSRRAGRLEART